MKAWHTSSSQISAELTTQMSLDLELQASTIVLTFSDVGSVVSTSTLYLQKLWVLRWYKPSPC